MSPRLATCLRRWYRRTVSARPRSRTSDLSRPLARALVSDAEFPFPRFGTSATIGSSDQYLDGSSLDRAILSCFIFAALVILFARAQRTREVLQHNAPLLIFLLYCLASTVWSDYPFVALKRWTKALGSFTMVLIVLTDSDVVSAIRQLVIRTAFILIPSSILLIKYYPEMGRYYDRWEGTVSYSGVATDKNALGAMCLILGLGTVCRS